MNQNLKSRSWIEIDLKNLENNINEFKKIMSPQSQLLAIIKANAYGHGMIEIAHYLNKLGIKHFGVATIDEGIKIRKSGVLGEILILGYTDINRVKELKKYDLTQTLIDYIYAKELNSKKEKIKCHLKIETGMNRLGIVYNNLSELQNVFNLPNLEITGIYSHLCCADSRKKSDIKYTEQQIKNFNFAITKLKEAQIKIPKIHLQSSYGLLNYSSLKYDYVRIGIAMYGVLVSADAIPEEQVNLKPVLSLKSKIILIRDIPKDSYISYGRTFKTKRPTTMAVLPIGYADGLPRNLKNGQVIIKDQIFPIVGRICMDQLMIDITDGINISRGDTAIIIGKSKNKEIKAETLAQNSDSITDELLSRMGDRLPVIFKDK